MMKALVMPYLMKTGSCNETQRIDSDDDKKVLAQIFIIFSLFSTEI